VSEFSPGATTPTATLTGLNGPPAALAFDSSGNLFVANAFQSIVSEFAPGATTPTATLTGLSNPSALAFDSGGNLFVANVGNHANASANTVSEFAPGATTPTATLTGLNVPTVLDFDNSGNLFVANAGNNTVSKFSPGATAPTATLTGLDGPTALAFDSSGNLFVANRLNSTVSSFAPGAITPTATLTGLLAPLALDFYNGDLYAVNYGGDTVSEFTAGSTMPNFTFTLGAGGTDPDALAFDASGNLFVANGDRVSEFSPLQGTPTAALTGLDAPTALAFDSSGNLFVTDANYNSTTISEFAPGATTPSATLTGLDAPVSLAFDSSGNLFVANFRNNTVSEFAPGATTPSAALTGLDFPNALAFDNIGNLYVLNFDVSILGPKVSIFAPGATTPTATLPGGTALAFFDGNLYVANVDTVSEFAPGTTTPSATLTGLNDATALAFDSSGNLFVANGRSGYNSDGTTVSEFAPGATTPTATLTGLDLPNALVCDNSGNLYVANRNNTVSEFAPGATAPTATLTGLLGTTALALDGTGTLYVANLAESQVGGFRMNTVSKFALTGNMAATTAVNIQSSLPARPMSLGGTNKAAVAGINLASTELVRVFTASTGTVTFGDSNQTGNITISMGTPAATAGAATMVLQSSSGSGQVILDDGSSSYITLNGNGGSVSLTAGTGGIVEQSTNTAGTADIANTASVTLTSSGAIGTGGQPLHLAATHLTVDTSAKSSTVSIASPSTGTAINLGTNVPGSLTLTTASLAKMAAGTLTLGNADSGPITVSSEISLAAEAHVNLASGGAINFNGGSFNTHGGNLTLTPGSGGVGVAQAGTDVNVGTGKLAFADGSNLDIAINGTTVDAQHTQLNVAGTVDLSGVNLVLRGDYTPSAGDVLIIVSATHVTGTFSGLANGSTTVFNGRLLRIGYTATTVTLTGFSGTAITSFTLGLQTGSATYGTATSLTFAITVATTTQGSNPPNVNLAVSGLPSGVDYALSKTSLPSSGGTVTLTMTTHATTGGGIFAFTVTATAGNTVSDVGTLTISRFPQTITFAALPVETYGAADFALAATSSSGLPVSYTSSGNATVYQSGKTWKVHVTGAGSATITAEQAGDGKYNPATTVSQQLTVNKENQTITFAALPIKTYGNADFALSGKSTSGLALSYTATGNATVSLVKGVWIVHLTGAGSSTITAEQTGDSNYNAASGVSRTLIIKKSAQAITFGTLPVATFGGSDFVLNSTSSSALPVTYTATGSATVSSVGGVWMVHIIRAGSAIITARQAGNANYLAAAGVSRTLTIKKATPSFSNLSSPPITHGKTSATFTGHVGSGAQNAGGSVTITIARNGIKLIATAPLDSSGNFSTAIVRDWAVGAYTVRYQYKGASNFNAITPSGTTILQVS
jgi:sugar lactone lactonase YvrE